MGAGYDSLGDHEQASEAFEGALEVCVDAQDDGSRVRAECEMCTADQYMRLGRTDEATVKYQHALKLADGLQDRSLKVLVCGKLGNYTFSTSILFTYSEWTFVSSEARSDVLTNFIYISIRFLLPDGRTLNLT